MTNYKFIAGHSNPQDRKLIREFAEEMNFDIVNIGQKILVIDLLLNCLNHRLSWLLKSQIYFLLSDSNALCDRLRLLLQQKQAGNISKLFNEKNVALKDKILECQCITPIQDKKLFLKLNLVHTK